MPVSRPRTVAEKFLAGGVSAVVVNAVVAPVVLDGSYPVDEAEPSRLPRRNRNHDCPSAGTLPQ